MLWDVIYEFFIKYVFGGTFGGSYYFTSIGELRSSSTGSLAELHLSDINAFTINGMSGSVWYMSLGNYLSLIATIISMVVILVLCCALIKKIYNMCAHIIG